MSHCTLSPSLPLTLLLPCDSTYKCKFCCGIGTWYCWGSTHFCDGCHKKQEKGTYLNRLPLDALPKCPGPDACPLGIEHPANGTEEFSLGCVICLKKW